MPETLTAPPPMPPLGTPLQQPPTSHVQSVLNTPSVCPKCHQGVRPTDYFCSNCGHNLNPTPLSTSITTQAAIYIGSIVLCPMGLIWGIRYFKQPDAKSKTVGLVAATLTTITLVIGIIALVNIIDQVNAQMSKQLENIQGF